MIVARVTEAHVGRKYTYDARQVFRIMGVDSGGVYVYGVTNSRAARAAVSHDRLDMLFECGRAEWGDAVFAADSIARSWADEGL